jgi:translation initiation factor IF-3
MLGVMTVPQALERARSAGLDLVEISPQADPPVCKTVDYGKFKYQEQKRQAVARKKQKVVEIKEVKLSARIEEHDYQVKMRAMQSFIADGNKVKITLRLRGREMAHQDIARGILNRVKEDLAEVAKTEMDARLEGRQMIMILVPSKTTA